MGTKIGLRIKELRIERDITMDMLVADMNSKYELSKPLNKSMIPPACVCKKDNGGQK